MGGEGLKVKGKCCRKEVKVEMRGEDFVQNFLGLLWQLCHFHKPLATWEIMALPNLPSCWPYITNLCFYSVLHSFKFFNFNFFFCFSCPQCSVGVKFFKSSFLITYNKSVSGHFRIVSTSFIIVPWIFLLTDIFCPCSLRQNCISVAPTLFFICAKIVQ